MIRGFVVCGEIGQACPVKCGMPKHDGKIIDFPSPTPLSYLPRPWGWGLKVEFQLFSSTSSTQPNTTKDIFTGTPCADPGNFCQGGGWGGGGSRLLNLFYSLKSQWFYYTFSRGEGSNFFQGWGSNRNPYNYNL